MFGRLTEQAFEYLASRPLVVAHLDQPLLFIGDEPVVMSADRPLPSFDPEGVPNVTGPGIDPRNIVHLQGNRGAGFAMADEILLAVSPTTVLVFGPIGQSWDATSVRISGNDAASTAEEHNSLVLDASVVWVAAHPDHPTFASMRMPEAKPIVRVQTELPPRGVARTQQPTVVQSIDYGRPMSMRPVRSRMTNVKRRAMGCGPQNGDPTETLQTAANADPTM